MHKAVLLVSHEVLYPWIPHTDHHAFHLSPLLYVGNDAAPRQHHVLSQPACGKQVANPGYIRPVHIHRLNQSSCLPSITNTAPIEKTVKEVASWDL